MAAIVFSTPGRTSGLNLSQLAALLLTLMITTPGLAASMAGQFAVPHGEHGGSLPPGGHHRP